MNDLQPIIEEAEENKSLVPVQGDDSSLWHYQPIKGLSFFQELVVISVVTVLGCVFTLTRLDIQSPDTSDAERVKTEISSLASIGLASIGTVEDRFLPGFKTPSLVRRFSSEENSLEWFASYPHSSLSLSTKKNTDLDSLSDQEKYTEKKQSSDPTDNSNLREALKLIAGDIYANNANNPPDHYSIPEKWHTDLRGNKIVYKKYNQNSAVVYSSNANEEDQGPDERHPFYALIWPPNNHPEMITPRADIAKTPTAPEKHIKPREKETQIEKPLEIAHRPQSLDTTHLSQTTETSLQKKEVEKKAISIPTQKMIVSLPSNSQIPRTLEAVKEEEKSPAIQVITKTLPPQDSTSTNASNPNDSLIKKIAALKPEDIWSLTPAEMKETHLVWFTESIRKLLSDEQLKVMPIEQWVYLSNERIHKMPPAMRNSMGQSISLFHPERIEKIFNIAQIESFVEENIDQSEVISALTERMSPEQIAGLSNAHFSVIVHFLDPEQISLARPEQVAMLSKEAYARLNFSQRAAFTPLQRAAEAKMVSLDAAAIFASDATALSASATEENQTPEKEDPIRLTQQEETKKKESTEIKESAEIEEENSETLITSTNTRIEDIHFSDPTQEKSRPQPLQTNQKQINEILSNHEIRSIRTNQVKDIRPQQIHTITASGRIHHFSESQIREFTSRQINSALSATRKNGQLAYLIHRLTPGQITMISPMLMGKIYLEWIPENGRHLLTPQQLSSLRIGDPAYLPSLTDQQFSNLSLQQVVLTGKKMGIQYLSTEQIHAMTSAQVNAFISGITNSSQLTYLVHRLTSTQVKNIAPEVTDRIYLDWISEGGRSVLTSEQLSAIRIGNPNHLSSLTEEQRQSLDSKKLAEIEKKGGTQYISQVLTRKPVVELKPEIHKFFEKNDQKERAITFLIEELNPQKIEAAFQEKGDSHDIFQLPASDVLSLIKTNHLKTASLFINPD